MADAVEVPTPTTEPVATEQPTKTEETKVEETKEVQETPEKPVEKPVEKAEDVFDLSDIEQNEKGEFVLTIDKDDPNSTVYKGKTPDEVLKAAKKGLLEKDKYIRELKAKELTQSTKIKHTEEPEEDFKVEAPNFDKILSETFKEYNIDPEMAKWDREKWKEYEATEGAVFAMEARQNLKNARLIANEKADLLNVDYLNDLILKEETEQVIEMVKDSGVEFGKDDYDAILKEIHKDPKNTQYFRKDGVRRNGVIPRLVSKKLFELKSASLEKSIGKKKDEEIATARTKKDSVVSVPATKKKVEEVRVSPKTIEDAGEALRQAMK